MRSRLSTRVTIALLALLVWSSRAGGEPITATYSVAVVNAFQIGFVAPFPSSFTLQLTFDSSNQGQPAVSDYGAPVFSSVPLPGVAPPAGFPVTDQPPITVHHAFPQPDATHLVTAAAIGLPAFGVGTFEGNAARYNRMLVLSQEFSSVLPPLIAPETFPLHLAAPGGRVLNFRYLECFTAAPFTGEGFADTGLCTGQGIGSRAAFYQGTATLTAVETPIPEPGTMALVGSSLAMVLARSRTRSRLRRSGERH